MDAAVDDRAGRPLAEVAASARGWHGVQLAVLAFIGLCGVLGDTDSTLPRWLQVTAGVLAITALALSCLSIFVVATVAWPFSDEPDRPAAGASGRLRTGVFLTYLAVAVMALAASTSWWPTSEASGDGAVAAAQVEITDSSGNTACGSLVEGPAGRIRLRTADGVVELTANALAGISPVDGC